MSDAGNHADREHSELSASSTHRWWNCPGSIALSRGIARASSRAADEGTAAHELAQLCLVNHQDAIEYLDRTVAGFAVTDEMAEGVQCYVDEVRRVHADVPDRAWGIEQRITLDSLNPPANMFGTADATTFDMVSKTLYVHDLKFGKGYRVEATDNPQLRYYALGAMLAIATDPMFAKFPVKRVVATIVQPRQPAAGADPIRSVEIDAADLNDWAFDLLRHADAAMQPDAPLAAGSWCKFCPAAGKCPKQAETALAVARTDFAQFIEAADATPPAVRTLSPDELGALLPKLALLEQWISDARKLAFQELAEGRDVPGWKLVESEGHAKWSDADDVAAELSLVYGVDPYATKIVSPAQARGLLRDAMQPEHKTKKAAEAAARAALASLTYRPRSTSLVPATDARPALLGGGSEFPVLPAINDESE